MSAARSAGFSKVLLTTEDDEIAAEGEALGFWQPFRRPADLASDTVGSEQVILNLLDWFRDTHSWQPQSILMLPPTSPFRTAALINDVLRCFDQVENAEAAISVRRLGVRAESVYSDCQGNLEPIAHSNDKRIAYVPSGAVYSILTGALRAHSNFIPEKFAWVEHSGLSTIDIDTPDDWAIAESVVAAGHVKAPAEANVLSHDGGEVRIRK
jgi:CMP-N,N'-diacetyllegionaminic acid synthase